MSDANEASKLAERFDTCEAMPVKEFPYPIRRCDGIDAGPTELILVDARSRSLIVRALKLLAATA